MLSGQRKQGFYEGLGVQVKSVLGKNNPDINKEEGILPSTHHMIFCSQIAMSEYVALWK
jgi:hypothetical protein